MPSVSRILNASASSVDTPIHGFPEAKARPFIVALPMRTPVNEPGPAEQVKISMSFTVSESEESIRSIIGKSVSLCVLPLLASYCAKSFSSSVTATVATIAVLSRDNIFIGFIGQAPL